MGIQRVITVATLSAFACLLLPSASEGQARRRGTQARGSLETVAAAARSGASMVEITLGGRNPCDVVTLDYGDGTSETLSIGGLPTSLRYDYAAAGTYRIVARGFAPCVGEATTSVRVTSGNASATRTAMRFRGLDRDNDGVITRREWRGSARSFDVHDWNGDGVLSGAEVLTGNRQEQQDAAEYDPTDVAFRNWTRAGFQALDHDGNSRITLDEWHYAPADFWRADRNRNNSLELTEFLAEDFDDDRGDRFLFLDTNSDGRIAPAEWHSTRAAFEWLDADRNGYLTRDEVDGESPGQWDRFDSVDIDNSETVSLREWHWSRASFDQLDTNRDGVLSRLEFGTDSDIVDAPTARRIVTVDPRQRWTSTRIIVAPGDIVSFEASGTIQMNEQRTDPASPAGSSTGRIAAAAPLPQAAAGALIASIDGGPAFEIGASTSGYRATHAGVLYLGVNDDHLADNTGSFRVVVTVTGR